MAAFHQTIIVGNLGREPETRYLTNGDAVCNFSVAVTEKWKKDGESKEQTTWYRVSAFGKLAEICGQYLKKGSSVMVIGKMTARKYEKDGVERESWELRADSMQMLGGRHDGQHTDQSAGNSESKPAQNSESNPRNAQGAQRQVLDDVDDIPFDYFGRGIAGYSLA